MARSLRSAQKEFLRGVLVARHPPGLGAAERTVLRSAYVQEQIQIIATAIGRPAATAPAIVKVNAISRFSSGRALSNDMLLLHHMGQIEPPTPGPKRCRFQHRVHEFPEGVCDRARTWLTTG